MIWLSTTVPATPTRKATQLQTPRAPDLHRISAPTLIVHGTEDPWFRFSHAELLAKLVPKSTLLAAEGEGHALPRNMYNPFATNVTDHILAAEAE